MSAVAVARSAMNVSLRRYSRSWGLWLLLLVAPIGARFMIARDDGSGMQVAIGGHLPVMTSATLGVCLGVVVSTLLLPVAFLYLRSNVTRRNPWQVDEVSGASRAAIMLGRFAADAVVLLASLTALTAAGWLLGWQIVTGPFQPGWIALPLWLVAAPALIGLAALRQLLDARPLGRRGFGELIFFILWMSALVIPIVVSERPSSFAVNMVDYAGFVRPLVAGSPSGDNDFSIGGGEIKPGRVPLDAERGISAPGYIGSRFAWVAIAIALSALASLVYAQHSAPRRPRLAGFLARLLATGPPPPAITNAPAAPSSRSPIATLVLAEFRLVGAGRLFLYLAIVAALLGVLPDFRHFGSPAGLLLLVFGLCAQAGRSEARGLRHLTATTATPPPLRRAALVVAGTAWAILLALPAALASWSLAPILLGAATGAAAGLVAVILAMISGSAFAARMVLLILWYVYLST
ncbi:MAG: hypothetical protein LH485_02950 [Sphingomonas bacterium]|nr:hypothetical protein [Sphingomonas bacterium]